MTFLSSSPRLLSRSVSIRSVQPLLLTRKYAQTHSQSPVVTKKPFDVLALGLGPAALSFAIAVQEQNSASSASAATSTTHSDLHFSSLGGLQDALVVDAKRPIHSGSPSRSPKTSPQELRVCFLEKQTQFAWHPGMMIPGSKMQISFLKDLATLRNPSSSYTFLSYLHSLSPSRLLSFISLSTFTPTRREFADYLAWAAQKVQRELGSQGEFAFGEEVIQVSAVSPTSTNENEVSLLRVTSRTNSGSIHHRFTRNLLVAAGGSPRLPPLLSSPSLHSSSRIVHSSAFLERLEPVLSSVVESAQRNPSKPIKLAIIGGGQSSAEIFLALRSTLAERLLLNVQQRPQVVLFTRKETLRPADDSPFSNEVFDPGMSQKVYRLDSKSRGKVLQDSKRTNYSVVNPDTIDAIYSEMYDQSVEEEAVQSGRSSAPIVRDPKLVIRPYSDLMAATPSSNSALSLTFANSLTKRKTTGDFDAVFCGTGYERQAYMPILFSDKSTSDSHVYNLSEIFSPSSDISKLSSSTSSSLQSSSSRYLPHSSFSHSSDTTTPDGTSRFDPSLPLSFSRSTPPSSPQIAKMSTSSALKSSSTAPNDFTVGENYRLALPEVCTVGGREVRFRPTVWLQGSNEATHGISDSLLSVMSLRAGEVLEGVMKEGNLN